MKKASLIFFLILNSWCFAQLQVVRDPIACAYGLKNADKKWVVPAQYQDIQVNGSGFFFCKEGEKWGILNRYGKTFVDTKYDQVYQLKENQFVLVNRKMEDNVSQTFMGIMDTNKTWILPLEFSSIQQIIRERFLVVKTTYPKNAQPKNQSTIVDAQGKLLIPYIDGIILYKYNEQEIFLVGDKQVNSSTLAGNVRFINHAGKMLSDSTFDMGTPCGENFTVVKNNKFGLFNSEGKPIVWPRFQFERNIYESNTSLPCLHSHHQFIFTENGKKGIVNGSWKVITEPIYERIIPINIQGQTTSPARYFGHRSDNNNYDLIDLNGKKLIEADTFLTKMIRIPQNNYYASDAYRVYYFYGVRQNNDFRWGILNGKGEVLIPATNANILVTSNFEALLVEDLNTNIPTVNRILLTAEENFNATPVTFKNQLDSIFLFQYENNYYPLIYDNTAKIWRQEMYGYNLPKSFGNLLLISGNLGGFIYNKTNNTFEKVKSIDLQNGGLPMVYTKEGVNIIHPRKGFLFKEFHTTINQQMASKNRIWVHTKAGKWRIYDTLGVQRIDTEFDVMSYDWDAMIAQQNSKKGMLDENYMWKIPPIFSDLFLFSKYLFVGITPTNRVAVINISKPTLIDTSFTSFIPLFFDATGEKVYYSLEKNGQSFCFDKNGNQVSLSKKEILINNWTEPTNYYYFNIQCAYEQRQLLNSHKNLVYDFFYPTYLNQIQGNRSTIINGVRGSSYEPTKYFKAEFLSSKAMTLSITRPPTVQLDYGIGSDGSSGDLELGNWIFKNDGSNKRIVFSDLFNPLSPIYQKQILDAIQENPDIKIDCNKPDILFSGVKQFSFHPNGIKLYFFEGESQAFELILTKTQLSKIPSAKWILAYLN
jgi:hypothetical protein